MGMICVSSEFQLTIRAKIKTKDMIKDVEVEDRTTHRAWCKDKPHVKWGMYCPECGVGSRLKKYQIKALDLELAPDAFVECLLVDSEDPIQRVYYVHPDHTNSAIRIDGDILNMFISITLMDVEVDSYEQAELEWDDDEVPTISKVVNAQKMIAKCALDLGVEIEECQIVIQSY